jgi:NADH-quinone oxidoreductase subunit F
MPDIDLIPLREVLLEYAPLGRSALLPSLQAAQKLYGCIPEPIAVEIGKSLGVPVVDISGVIDFYSMLYRNPVGKTVVRVCNDVACAAAGSEDVLSALDEHLAGEKYSARDGVEYTVEHSPCLGLCPHAPAVLIGEHAVGEVEPAQVQGIFDGSQSKRPDFVAGGPRILTVNCGNEQPASLVDYQSNGGYRALKKALVLAPQVVIDEVKASGLVGRGGAAFPTGVKWQGCSDEMREPKYIICNADESEPGTFKDRVLLEGDPQRVLEGMIIAAYAIGSSEGYIYIRGEYPHAYRIIEEAVQEARQAGLLGQNIMGSDFHFDVELRRGAGAYICGEETAMFESIEGRRGFPRIKPPFPTMHGLFGNPTVVNNVETLCNIPYIIQYGALKYRQMGTQQSPGTKLFCISGDVRRAGVYEVPFGLTMRHLIFDLAGGIPNGQPLQAVLVGGAAGAFAGHDHLDVPLTFEDLNSTGLSLGSGVLMVFDGSRDLRDSLLRLGRFFAEESCGKCYPCQLGTQRQYEILHRLASGRLLPGDPERLLDVGWTMSDASICGLGQTAATAVLSAMKLWPEIFTQSEEFNH